MKKYLLIIILISITLLTGCVRGGGVLKSENFDSGYPLLSKFLCAYIIEENHLKDGEDIEVKLYLGTSYQSKDDLTDLFKKNDVKPDDVVVKLYIERGKYIKKLLQKGEETHINPEYTLEFESEEKKECMELKNFNSENYPLIGEKSAYEKFTIPSNWFNSSIGAIVWSIQIFAKYTEGIDFDNSFGVSDVLYYRKDANKIILYNNYYDYYDDIIG